MSTRALTSREARRTVRSPLLWLSLPIAALLAWNSSSSTWQAATYEGVQATFMVVALAVLVIALLAGGRDHARGRSALAEDAPLGHDARAVARLCGMWPAVSVAALYAAAVFVVVRLEGGLWIGDAPHRTDAALYSVPEMLQPLALCVLAASIGVAIGRCCRLRLPLAIGAIGFAMFGFVSWAFQSAPMVYLTPVQIQPVRRVVDITSAASVPDSWLLEAPGVDHGWSRVMVAPAMSAWHDVYLIGLAVVFAGLAVRGRRASWLLVAGTAAALVGVLGQVLSAPGAIAVGIR